MSDPLSPNVEWLIRSAVLREREECAKLAEQFTGFTGAGYCDLSAPGADINRMHDYGRGGCDAQRGIVAAIRARSSQ